MADDTLNPVRHKLPCDVCTAYGLNAHWRVLASYADGNSAFRTWYFRSEIHRPRTSTETDGHVWRQSRYYIRASIFVSLISSILLGRLPHQSRFLPESWVMSTEGNGGRRRALMRLKHLCIVKLDSNRLDSYSGTAKKRDVSQYRRYNLVDWEKIKSGNKQVEFDS